MLRQRRPLISKSHQDFVSMKHKLFSELSYKIMIQICHTGIVIIHKGVNRIMQKAIYQQSAGPKHQYQGQSNQISQVGCHQIFLAKAKMGGKNSKHKSSKRAQSIPPNKSFKRVGPTKQQKSFRENPNSISTPYPRLSGISRETQMYQTYAQQGTNPEIQKIQTDEKT